jgi:hypothetical protein
MEELFERPTKHTVSRYYRPGVIISLSLLVVIISVVQTLTFWSMGKVQIWPCVAMFLVGAVIGSTSSSLWLRYLELAWPFQRLYARFTGGRFFTFACPYCDRAYWQAVRDLKQQLKARGLPAGPGLWLQLQACAPMLVAAALGILLEIKMSLPGFLVFYGCVLTLGGVLRWLWWRSLPE